MLPKSHIIAVSAAILLAAVGCGGQPATIEVEVTREVPVTQEVPVTVETVRTITATREVPVTQEVPITVVVPQTVEVTREVAVPQTIEVTREVPVTRASEATPAPSVAPTASLADTPTAPPPPTVTPTVSPTSTPPAPEPTRFGSWTLDEQQHHEGFEIHRFRNEALEQTGVQPPTLTYQCDTRGRRTMYINWRDPITAGSSDRPSAARDPFSQYRDIPYYALLEYAGGLLEFVDDLRLSTRDQDDLDEIWDKVEDRWLVGQGASHLDADPTPDALVDLLRDRTHRSVRIGLAFYQESIDPENKSKYGPPSLADIVGDWIVLSDRTQINDGSMGELRQAIRGLYSVPVNETGKRMVMTATITAPGQPIITVAKWDVEGIRLVRSHCESIRPF